MPAKRQDRTDPVPTRYKIVVRGPISPRLLDLLEGPTVGESRAHSVLTCEIVDQAKLQAVLGWLQDEDVEIMSVEPIGP